MEAVETRPLPAEVVAQMDRQFHEDLGDGTLVPAYCEFLNAEGHQVFCGFNDMTIGRFEQATEYHTRMARQKLGSYAKKPGPRKAKDAAWHILRARIYRGKYDWLSGQKTTEDGMPFAHDRY